MKGVRCSNCGDEIYPSVHNGRIYCSCKGVYVEFEEGDRGRWHAASSCDFSIVELVDGLPVVTARHKKLVPM